MNVFKSININDIWGGVSASAIVLPQAMAFGVALLMPYTGSAALGAMAGIIAAALLSFASNLSRGTQGLVSSPTGPTLVLLSAALASLYATGITGQKMMTAMALIVILAGVTQIIIGVSGGGRLIKYIPYPVVAGFMTGSAILMILSQLNLLQNANPETQWSIWHWTPVMAAVATFATVALVPKWLPKIPGTVAGLIIGSIVFHIVMFGFSATTPEQWLIGVPPSFSNLQFGLDWSLVSDLPWFIIISSAAALAILSSLDTLLTAVVADVATESRHNATKELVGQGVGYMGSALLGGIAGAGTTGATLVAIKSGGRNWVGAVVCCVLILVILALGSVVAVIPISALAGIIIYVAVMDMIERDLLAWIKRRRTRVDALIAILVTVVTVAYDLIVAVGVGISIAVLQFIYAQIHLPIVYRRSTVTQQPSLCRRSVEARELLKTHGERVVQYELQGNLFFGTVDRLFEELSEDLNHPVWLILNVGRVSQVDLTAMKMFQHMADRLYSQGGQLLFSNVRRGIGFGKKVKKTLRKISRKSHVNVIKTFTDSDEALEYAEDCLLKELGFVLRHASLKVELESVELCSEFDGLDMAAFSSILKFETIKAGKCLFKVGDFGDDLYIVLRGEVDAVLPYSKHHYIRLAKFVPGTFFGEVAFLQPGPRTAEGRVIYDAEVAVLNREGFTQLNQQRPEAGTKLLLALGRNLGNHLRWSNEELRRLAG